MNKMNNKLFDDVVVNVEALEAETKESKARNAKAEKDINAIAERWLENPTDEKLFQELWKRSWWGLRQKAFGILKDNDMTEEIVITTLQKVWEKKDMFNPDIAKFSTWMYRICVNEALAYRNRKFKDNFVDNDISDIYAKTIYQDGGSEAFCDDASKYSDKFGSTEDGEMGMLDYEGVLNNMLDASLNVIQNINDDRVKICVVEKNRSVFMPIIEKSPKFAALEALIKKDDDWENVKNENMRLDDISIKYDFPLSSVKNWIHKAKMELNKAMKKGTYHEIYEMWEDVR